MEIEIVWAKQAENGLLKTINYLKKEWTTKEILRLEGNIKKFVSQIQLYPAIYPVSKEIKHLRKGKVDENNYIVYRVYPT